MSTGGERPGDQAPGLGAPVMRHGVTTALQTGAVPAFSAGTSIETSGGALGTGLHRSMFRCRSALRPRGQWAGLQGRRLLWGNKAAVRHRAQWVRRLGKVFVCQSNSGGVRSHTGHRREHVREKRTKENRQGMPGIRISTFRK